MKCFVIFPVFISICLVGLALAENAVVVQYSQKCKGDENASTEDVSSFASGEVPETPEGKCLIKCMGKEHKIIKDNKIDSDEFVKKVNSFSGNNKAKETAAKDSGKLCADVTDEADECNAAYKIWKCVVDEFTKQGVKLFD